MAALWTPAYVAIGSNLDDPQAQVRAAFESLASLDRCRLICRSKLYRTVPLGPQDQPDFINAAAGLLTQLGARELLAALKKLEQTIGRESPVVRWGPRRIDFDLLVFGTERSDAADLTIPHPGVPVRNFVLYPLADIAPDLLVPGHGRVRDLAERVGPAGLTPIS
jgi:2-amino-4-hydroxy-6-hydroxymethyldihydropteridine diphosphokinase